MRPSPHLISYVTLYKFLSSSEVVFSYVKESQYLLGSIMLKIVTWIKGPVWYLAYTIDSINVKSSHQ